MEVKHGGKIYWLTILAVSFLQLAIPSFSHAVSDNLSAGFAPQSIWLSRSHVVAGDSVNIFTVLYNSSDNPITGQVIFSVDGTAIGTKQLTLKDGETQIASIPWIAQTGNHSVSARISNTLIANTDTSASVLNRTTGNIIVSVEAPPPPSPAFQALNSTATAIFAGVASSAPAVTSALTLLYDKTEALRAEAKSVLEKQVAESADTPTSALAGGGTGSANSPSNSNASSSFSLQNSAPFLSTAGRYAALAGLAVVNSRTLFYIALALVLLLLVQMLRVFLRERNKEY